MGFKLLSFLFMFGSIFTTTPASIEVKGLSLGRKIYILAIVAIVTTGEAVSLYYKQFFLKYIHIKVVLCFLDELTLYGLYFYSCIIIGLKRYRSWKLLIENLKSTSYLLVETRKQKKNLEIPYSYLNFVILNLLHVISSCYVIYIGWKIDGFLYVKREGTAHLLIYLDFFTKIVFTHIVLMLHSRYEGLKSILSNFVASTKQQKKLPLPLMKNIQYTMCLLKKTVDIYNDLFAWPTFLIICFTTLDILNAIDFAMFYDDERLQLFDNIVLNATLLLWIFAGTAVLIFMYDSVVQEAERIVSVSYDLRWSLRDSQILDDLKFEEFTNLLEKNLPSFTAANFFVVGRWTILSLLGTVVTFLIVMIQFGND